MRHWWRRTISVDHACTCHFNTGRLGIRNCPFKAPFPLSNESPPPFLSFPFFFSSSSYTMDVKATRHTSTNLEDLQEKIAELLKDPAEALDYAPVDVDNMSPAELKEFAEKGTHTQRMSDIRVVFAATWVWQEDLVRAFPRRTCSRIRPKIWCTYQVHASYSFSTCHCLLTTMLLIVGERIVVLKHIKDDIYMVKYLSFLMRLVCIGLHCQQKINVGLLRGCNRSI